VALAAACFYALGSLEMGFPVEKKIFVLVFTATFLAYGFVKFFPLLPKIWIKKSAILWFWLLAGIIMLMTLQSLPLRMLFFMGVVASLTFLYTLPLHQNALNFRNVYGLKAYLVALSWAAVSIALPAVLHQRFNTDILPLFAQFFLWVLVWMIPFDIRDLEADPSNLGTLPQRLGVNKTKAVGVFVMLLILGLEVFRADTIVNAPFFIIWISTALLLVFTPKKQSEYYSTFWVESIPIVWFLLEKVISIK
jgi:hypothetical protein